MNEKLNFNSDYSKREIMLNQILSNAYPSQFGDCLIWRGKKDNAGHGICFFNGKSKRAHRVVMLLSGKDISGKIVAHVCGNPSCCQPSHMIFSQENSKKGNLGRKFVPLYSLGRYKISRSQLQSARNNRRES